MHWHWWGDTLAWALVSFVGIIMFFAMVWAATALSSCCCCCC
jgi:hypothetical protein